MKKCTGFIKNHSGDHFFFNSNYFLFILKFKGWQGTAALRFIQKYPGIAFQGSGEMFKQLERSWGFHPRHSGSPECDNSCGGKYSTIAELRGGPGGQALSPPLKSIFFLFLTDASLHVDHPGDVHGSRSLSPSSHQGSYLKKMYTYHLDRAPWSVTKTHSPLCIIKKNHHLSENREQHGCFLKRS